MNVNFLKQLILNSTLPTEDALNLNKFTNKMKEVCIVCMNCQVKQNIHSYTSAFNISLLNYSSKLHKRRQFLLILGFDVQKYVWL